MIYIDIWQKPTQYCKAIILQLKMNLKINLSIQMTVYKLNKQKEM